VLELDWRRYGMSQSSGSLPQSPLMVMIHMASVWVPFTSESKDAIADYDEIRAEIKLGLQECGRKLSAYINKRRKMKYEGDRRSVFEKYIKEVVEACNTIKGKIDKKALAENLQAIAEKVTAKADQVLDDHGKVIRKKSGAEEEYGENVVVVDRDAPPAQNFELKS
jgi:DNA topoisomerase-6 subunit B